MTEAVRQKVIRLLGSKIVGDRTQLRHLAREVRHVKKGEGEDPAVTRERKGMRPARILSPIFAGDGPQAIAFARMALQGGVIGLMLENMAWLKTNPQTPALYHAGVIYKPEKHRTDHGGHTLEYGEDWQTIPWVIYHGFGDCEDLGAWRAAELRMQGVKATPHIAIRKLADGAWRAHVQVKWPDGHIEDPSAKLGMYAYA